MFLCICKCDFVLVQVFCEIDQFDAKQNTLCVKKSEATQKQHSKQVARCNQKLWYPAEAKKLKYF